jgi:hypothetical protein
MPVIQLVKSFDVGRELATIFQKKERRLKRCTSFQLSNQLYCLKNSGMEVITLEALLFCTLQSSGINKNKMADAHDSEKGAISVPLNVKSFNDVYYKGRSQLLEPVHRQINIFREKIIYGIN